MYKLLRTVRKLPSRVHHRIYYFVVQPASRSPQPIQECHFHTKKIFSKFRFNFLRLVFFLGLILFLELVNFLRLVFFLGFVFDFRLEFLQTPGDLRVEHAFDFVGLLALPLQLVLRVLDLVLQSLHFRTHLWEDLYSSLCGVHHVVPLLLLQLFRELLHRSRSRLRHYVKLFRLHFHVFAVHFKRKKINIRALKLRRGRADFSETLLATPDVAC